MDKNAIVEFEADLIELLEKWGYKVKQPINRLMVEIKKGELPIVEMNSYLLQTRTYYINN